MQNIPNWSCGRDASRTATCWAICATFYDRLKPSVALLSLQHSLFLASSSFCARSQCNRVLFLSALEATRASQRALFVHEDFISIGSLFVSIARLSTLFHSLSLHSPSNPPIYPSTVTRRSLLPCRLRPHCLARSCRRHSLSVLPSRAAQRRAGTRQLVVESKVVGERSPLLQGKHPAREDVMCPDVSSIQ